MDKRALWSKILGMVALIFIVLYVLAGPLVPGRNYLILLGNILAAACAILSRRSSRKIVLWGAGVGAATIILWAAFGLIIKSRGNWPIVPPIFVNITFIVRILCQLAIVGGTIDILLGKRPASPPSPGS